MKIGKIAGRLDTTIRTLRFYEEQGLVHPARSAGGTRRYDAEDEARFSALLALTGLGFSLESLHDLANVRSASSTGDQASRSVAERLQAMDDALASQLRAIQRQRSDLAKASAFLDGCHGCRRKPTRAKCDACAVSRGWQDSVVLRVVWDERDKD